MNIKTTLISLLLVISLPAHSQELFFANKNEPHGKIIGNAENVANDIYSVNFVALNGDLFPKRSLMRLKPGKYTVKVVMGVTNLSQLPAVSNRNLDGKRELILVVEAGKSYYVGAKINRRRGPRYHTILWRVEDSPT